MFKTLKELPLDEYFAPGHRMCAGCTVATLVRIVLKAAGENTIVVTPTGCLEVASSYFPETAWRVPWIHVAFENAAAVASGIEAAIKALRRKGLTDEDPHVIVLAGDGGTFDIGLQALSGALERGHDFVYICYDNEAYMNTGIQRSSATPYGAWTTTSPFGKKSIGQKTRKKDLVGIAVAHRIPYAATATPAYPVDLANKVVKAIKADGPAVIHALTPCPTGWRFDVNKGIEIAKLAVLTGVWPLYEVENGVLRLTVKVPKRRPVIEYLEMQGRFKHLPPEEIEKIQAMVDEQAKQLGLGPVVEYPAEKRSS